MASRPSPSARCCCSRAAWRQSWSSRWLEQAEIKGRRRTLGHRGGLSLESSEGGSDPPGLGVHHGGHAVKAPVPGHYEHMATRRVRSTRHVAPLKRGPMAPLRAALDHPIISTLVATALIAAFTAGVRVLSRPSEVDVAHAAVEKLGVGLSAARYREFLGSPQIHRTLSTEASLLEEIWVTDLYAVQTVADADRTVQMYSVTSRDNSWSPRVEILNIPLNRKGFEGYVGAPELQDGVSSWGGPRGDYWFSEAKFFGGGVYRTLVLTASDSGAAPTMATVEIPIIFGDGCGQRGPMCPVTDDISRQIRTAHDNLVVTTYTVLDQDMLPLDVLPQDFRFGPSLEDVMAVDGS